MTELMKETILYLSLQFGTVEGFKLNELYILNTQNARSYVWPLLSVSAEEQFSLQRQHLRLYLCQLIF